MYILTILVSYHPHPPSPLLLLLNYLNSRVCRTIMNLDDKSKISFLTRQGTLPRQSVFVGFIHGTEFRWHSVDGVSVRNWFLGGRWRSRVGSILAEMVMRETLDGFQGGLQIGGRMITHLRYDDDITVGHFGGRTIGVGGSPRPSQPQIQPTHQRRQDQGNGERRHSVPHTHSEWTTGASGYVSVLGSMITEDGVWWVYDGIPYQVRGHAIGASLQKIWKSHSILISTKIRLMKALVWPVATYRCVS